MKTVILLAIASLVGLGVWYPDNPILHSAVARYADNRAVEGGQNEVARVREGLGNLQQRAGQAPLRYLTAAVEEGEIRRIVTATATVQATAKVEIGSQLSGQIAEVFVDFNDKVKKGQPLAQLDPRSFQARVDAARAAVNLADSNVNIAKRKLEHSRIDALASKAQVAILRARLDKAKVNLDAAQADLRRKEELRRTVSVVVLEDAIRKKASSEAELREAKGLAEAHEQEVTGRVVDVRRAESESASAVEDLAEKKALLRQVEIDLERTSIRSPINGVIVGRNVDEGQTLAAQLEAKTLFVAAGDLRQMQIEAKVDEADISRVQVGQQAIFTVDSYPGRTFTATVRQIRKAPEVQQNVVTYTVVLSTTNDDDALLPGMTALVHITVEQVGPIPKVPLAALRFNPKSQKNDMADSRERLPIKSTVVWTLTNSGEPKPLHISIGAEDDAYAALLSGNLAKGDPVIVGEVKNHAPRQLFGIRLGF
jgi:HlyD family secretion protein